MKSIILNLLAFGFLFSCSQEKAKEEALYKTVMDIHNEVMPKMGVLRGLSKLLQVQADSIVSDSTSEGQERLTKIDSIVSNLEKANESMMQWMRNFNPLKEGTPHGEVLQYLIEQKRQIDKVKKDMLKAKKEADQYFFENQN